MLYAALFRFLLHEMDDEDARAFGAKVGERLARELEGKE